MLSHPVFDPLSSPNLESMANKRFRILLLEYPFSELMMLGAGHAQFKTAQVM